MTSLGTIAGVNISAPQDIPPDAGRWLLHGPQGGGKTYLASTLARIGPLLFIDTVGEKGIRSFQGAPWAKNITVARVTSITALDDLFYKLNEGGHGFKSVVIDSLTGVQKMAMRYMLGHEETAVREIRRGTNPADQRTWGQTLDIMVDVATFWYGLADGDRPEPMHVVMTAQTKVTDDEITESRDRVPDVQRGALSITLATPDYIVFCEDEANPDYLGDDEALDEDGNPINPTRHIIRFGGHPGYRTKARVPANLRGKLPSVIGRGKQTPDLAQLSRVLGVGSMPAVKAAKAAPTPAAAPAPVSK